MSNKRRVLALVIIFVAAAVIMTLYLPSSEHVEKENAGFSLKPQAEAPADAGSVKKPKNGKIDSEGSDLNSEALLMASARLQKKKDMQEAANREMPFFGKVVDQNGNPVSGATVRYRYAYYPDVTLPTFSWSVKQSTTTTNERGEFEIEGVSGVHLTVTEVDKSGYEVKSSQLFQYRPRTVDDEPFQADPTNPIVFHAWKKGYPAKELKIGNDYWTVPANGKEYKLPLPGMNDDFKISFLRENDSEKEWTVRLTLQNGGLIASDQTFMYEAPESGYEPVWQATSTAQNFEKNFYIKAKNGKVFGVLEMRFAGYYRENEDYVQYSYRLNSSGSRNLLPVGE